jgi:hypothetical protein
MILRVSRKKLKMRFHLLCASSWPSSMRFAFSRTLLRCWYSIRALNALKFRCAIEFFRSTGLSLSPNHTRVDQRVLRSQLESLTRITSWLTCSAVLSSCGGSASDSTDQFLRVAAQSDFSGFQLTLLGPTKSTNDVRFAFSTGAADAASLRRSEASGAVTLAVYMEKVGNLPSIFESVAIPAVDASQVRVQSVRCLDRDGNEVGCAAAWSSVR